MHNVTILDLRTRQCGSKIRVENYRVEAIAIHPDETFFVYTQVSPSEIVLLDMQGNKLRTVQREY